eukprot:1701133-Amphidinium_carterae.1
MSVYVVHWGAAGLCQNGYYRLLHASCASCASYVRGDAQLGNSIRLGAAPSDTKLELPMIYTTMLV